MSSVKKDFILLIPCYNNVNGLIKSINSVQYTIDKFEILVVDDGSTPPIPIADLQNTNREKTISVLRLSENKGIVNALNAGLKKLKARNDYNYIARLDAGDTCHPKRFTKQVEFLNAHPDIFLLGTWCRFENSETGKGYDYITKTKHEEIIKEMHYKCSFIHPTVMFRKEVLEAIGNYPEKYAHAEDYAYFWQILNTFKCEILPLKLLRVDFSDENVSAKNYKKQLMSRTRIVKEFGIYRTDKFLGILLLLGRLLIPKQIIGKIKLSR